jgi:chromosome partitioning protein
MPKRAQGPPRPPGARILAIANQQCGVGKTTTTINLATCPVDAGRRTLVVDLDPPSRACSNC